MEDKKDKKSYYIIRAVCCGVLAVAAETGGTIALFQAHLAEYPLSTVIVSAGVALIGGGILAAGATMNLVEKVDAIQGENER